MGINNWVNYKRGLWLDPEFRSTTVSQKDHSHSHSLWHTWLVWKYLTQYHASYPLRNNLYSIIRLSTQKDSVSAWFFAPKQGAMWLVKAEPEPLRWYTTVASKSPGVSDWVRLVRSTHQPWCGVEAEGLWTLSIVRGLVPCTEVVLVDESYV